MASARLLSSLRAFVATGVAILATRLALLRVEAEEEIWRLSSLLLWSVTALIASLFGLLFFALLITVLLWESQRLLALSVFTVLFWSLAALAFAQARRRARQESRLFAASLSELKRDAEALAGDHAQNGEDARART
ncbi:MAG: phage holin family protein [Rhodocyclaceae bacterium]|nr:phage holin family protein [Rhodocyclaceae bacterium]